MFLLPVLALLIVSGVFSLFDFSLTACRKTRMEKEHGRLYKAVIKAAEKAEYLRAACLLWSNILRIAAAFITAMVIMRFLETAQTGGITAVFIIVASALVLGLLTALLGDGLPKLLSCIAPEKIAAYLLLPVKILCFPLIPVILPVLKLDSFIRTILQIRSGKKSITEDELRNALLEGEKSGIVQSNERTMVEGVFYLGDRQVGAFMTHRSEIHWLDYNMPYEKIREKALKYRHQRCFPVVNGGLDEIVGAAYLEDIILDFAEPQPQGLRAIMKKAQFVPETMSALKAFESFKQGQANFLFVMDEYGGLAGIISIRALVEEIVGEMSSPVHNEEPLVKQEDGSMIADGTLKIDDAVKALSLTTLPENGDFHTLAGFVLHLAGELPCAGDSFEYEGYIFKVKEMDGNRINKLLISKAVSP
ncbi:MAG: hemolysin family protein [Treponema sp.]|jgi:putative hemolysin|nr:hemolysin family protein [Treponema sp.]